MFPYLVLRLFPFPSGQEKNSTLLSCCIFLEKSQDETLFAHSQRRFRCDTVPRTEPAEELMGGQAVGMEQKEKKMREGSKGLVKQNGCSSYGMSNGKNSKTQ